MQRTEVQIVVSAKDITQQAFKKIQTSLDRVRQSVFSTKTAFAGLIATIGSTATISSFVKTAAGFEKISTSLETVLGSSIRARKSMEWITDFTAKTPYELEDVADAFVRLSAYGFDATKSLKTLGDTASAMGKPLIQAVEAFADAATGEFERLKEFGVRAKTAGEQVTFSWTENGQTLTKTVSKTSSDITTALLDIFDKFQGGMDKQSRTFNGMMSNLREQWTLFKKQVMDSGLFDYIKLAIGAILNKIQELKDKGKLDQWAKNISDSIIDMTIKVAQSLDKLVSWVKDNTLSVELGVIGYFLFGKKGLLIGAYVAAIDNAQKNMESWLTWFKAKIGDAKDYVTKKFTGDKSKPMVFDFGDNTYIRTPKADATQKKSSLGELVNFLEGIKVEVNQIHQDIKAGGGPVAGGSAGKTSSGSGSAGVGSAGPYNFSNISLRAPSLSVAGGLSYPVTSLKYPDTKTPIGLNIPELKSPEIIQSNIAQQVTQKPSEMFEGLQKGLQNFADQYGSVSKNMEMTTGNVVNSMTESFVSFFDATSSGFMNLKQLATNILGMISQEIMRMVIRMAMIRAFTSMGLISSGGGAGAAAAVMHTGGIVGYTYSPKRQVSPALFAAAPRLHDGLRPDEFPAILQKGEQVIPKNAQPSQMKIINVLDPSVVGDYLQTQEGENIVLNIMQKNGGVV